MSSELDQYMSIQAGMPGERTVSCVVGGTIPIAF